MLFDDKANALERLDDFYADRPDMEVHPLHAEEARGVTPKGASGYGVRLLNRLVADHYES